jgi:hypothetical protein
MEIKDFNYRSTPVNKTHVFEVHSLSPSGLNQYLDKNSYVHKFLKSVNPYKESNEFNFYPEGNLNTCHNFNSIKSDVYDLTRSMNKNSSERNQVVSINQSNYHKNLYHKPSIQSSNYNQNQKEENKTSTQDFTNLNSNDKDKEYNYETKNEKSEEDTQLDSNKKTCPQKSNFGNNLSKTAITLNKKNHFLQTSKQVFNKNSFFQQNNNKHNRYNSLKYSEDYLNTINTLKEKFSEDLNDNTFKHKILPKSTLVNFKSYDVPHLEYKRQSNNFRINLIRDKLENTFLKSGKNSNVNFNHSANEDIKLINNKIEKENLKLKNYFDNVKKFTKKDHNLYPSVDQITNSVNLRTTKLRLLNNKYMGERYDPTNYS